MAQTVVIVGASHASCQAVDTLRREAIPDRSLVGDERTRRNRPPLSKKFLAGELERERLCTQRATTSSTASRCALASGHGDRPRRAPLHLGDGSELGYDALLLCVSSRPRRLESGHSSRGSTACARSPTSTPSRRPRRCAPHGGGGAATSGSRPRPARHLGLDVTVLETADRLARVIAPRSRRSTNAATPLRACASHPEGHRLRGRTRECRALRRAGNPARS
jgi:3-phenylpropionate/trans-cinnamate dioxygenase ferredoxin reductase subunit